MKRFLRKNGLSLVVVGLFFLFLVGQAATGYYDYNSEQQIHRRPWVNFADYLYSPHFLEAVFENWESEFLQMAAYVVLTVFLFQKGSAESKDPDKKERAAKGARRYREDPKAPAPVRAGGWKLKLYEHSLSLALFGLFLLSWLGHAMAGVAHYNEEQREHGEATISLAGYISSARFWFESFQNWQSEFLAVAAIVILSIWLREKGSPESKPVPAPHTKTGG
jgi:hypothetical protein